MFHIEDKEQKALIDWCSLHRIIRPNSPCNGHFISEYIFAIPNGGKRDKREAKRLKEQGVRQDIPDLFLPIPTVTYAGLFIEMKRPAGYWGPAGKSREGQKFEQIKLRDLGYKVVETTLDGAIEEITDYLSSF